MAEALDTMPRSSRGLDPDPSRRASTERLLGRAGLLGRWDATAVLTGYAMLLLLIPATQTISSLGGLGTPATIYSLLALLWFAAARLTGRLPAQAESAAPRRAMCVLAASILLAYAAAAGRQISFTELQSADRDLILLASWAGLVAIASTGIRDTASLDRLLRRVVVGATIVAAVGTVEFATTVNLVRFVVIPGLQTNIVDTGTQLRSSFTRPMATTSQPLEYGAVLAMVLPFALQQAFDPARRSPRSFLRRWGPVLLIAMTLPLTVSRTAMIGIAVVLLFLVPTWKPRRRRPAYAVILLGTVAIKALVPGLLGTIFALFTSSLGNSDSSTQARTQDYAGVAPYIAQRPWFGRGFGTFIPALFRYTDNTYLLALVEMGAFGVFALLVLYLTGIHCGRAGRRLHTEEPKRELGQTFAAAFGVALVVSATFDTLTFPMFSGLMFLFLGCAGAYLGIARREARDAAGQSGPGLELEPS